MKIESTKGTTTTATVEDAVCWLVEAQPSRASVDGHSIDCPSDSWTAESATDALAAAMADGDWYWIDGSAYCPACVECASPAIDADDPLVQRGGAVSLCACCRTDYAIARVSGQEAE